ncbi:MAG TPA: chemotaxis protein CheW [Bacillales bacterium]|nr:chemotaxis protein CheW [Bacillales bacterium]
MGEEMKAIVFQLNEEEYGVDILQVRSIEKMQAITRVPRAPEFVSGVINLRGVVTPVIDLRKRFSLKQRDTTEETRILVVDVDGTDAGLIVDHATDIVDIPVHAIEPPADIVGGVKAEYLHGVAKLKDRLLILLNLEKVLNPGEVEELKSFRENDHGVG